MLGLSGSASDLQSRAIKDRIAHIENFLGDLCQNLGKASRKNASLRDTGDAMVTRILEYVGREKINTSSIQGLKNYAQYLSAVEDYRNTMIERTENKVIQPLSKYEEYLNNCKHTVKSTLSIRDKEKQKQLKLSQILERTPTNGRNIAQAEATAESARQKVAAQDRALFEEIDKLEEKKLSDIKNILKNHTQIQIIFHAKALEMLTEAYNHILDINCENDLDEFRNMLRQQNLKDFMSSKQSLNQTANYTSELSATGGSLPVTPKASRVGESKGKPRHAYSSEHINRDDNSDVDSIRRVKSGRKSSAKQTKQVEDSSNSESDNY